MARSRRVPSRVYNQVVRTSNLRMSALSIEFARTAVETQCRMSAFTFVPTSECIRAALRETEWVASIAQDANHRCNSIGFGRDLSNSDTMSHERGGSPCELLGQWCTCRSKTCAFRTLRVLPRRCPNPNRPTRISGDRRSSHARTCFGGYHRRVDRPHAGLRDTAFHPTILAPRMKLGATCRPSSVRNLHSHSNTKLFPGGLEVSGKFPPAIELLGSRGESCWE